MTKISQPPGFDSRTVQLVTCRYTVYDIRSTSTLSRSQKYIFRQEEEFRFFSEKSRTSLRPKQSPVRWPKGFFSEVYRGTNLRLSIHEPLVPVLRMAGVTSSLFYMPSWIAPCENKFVCISVFRLFYRHPKAFDDYSFNVRGDKNVCIFNIAVSSIHLILRLPFPPTLPHFPPRLCFFRLHFFLEHKLSCNFVSKKK